MTPPFGRFFLPGPTEVLPEVLRAQQRPMIGHRGAPMESLLGALDAPLKAVFRTAHPVVVVAASATGLMEAAVRNGVRHRVLCLVNGAFSERFAKIAQACAKEVVRADVPWGETFEPDAVRRLVRASGADAVTLVHSETSTGALAPLAEIAEVVRETPEVLLLVDAVTSLGGSPVETDRWRLDFVLTGSQKALGLPPGLALGVGSARLLERARTLPGRGIYLDLVAHDAEMRRRQTPFTPAIPLLYALDAQLARILAGGGIEARWARHCAMLARTEQWVGEHGDVLGLAFLPRQGRRSWTVSCLKLLGEQTGGQVAKRMEARGYVIGAGYGKLKDSTIRIGHMGDHTVDELDGLLDGLAAVLRRG